MVRAPPVRHHAMPPARHGRTGPLVQHNSLSAPRHLLIFLLSAANKGELAQAELQRCEKVASADEEQFAVMFVAALLERYGSGCMVGGQQGAFPSFLADALLPLCRTKDASAETTGAFVAGGVLGYVSSRPPFFSPGAAVMTNVMPRRCLIFSLLPALACSCASPSRLCRTFSTNLSASKIRLRPLTRNPLC